MNFKAVVGRVMLGIALGAIIGVVLLGTLGLLLAGWEGMIGGATLGLALGTLAGVSLIGFVEAAGSSNFVKMLGERLHRDR